MKILDTLRSAETEEKVADLRVKLLFVLGAGIGVTLIMWLFRRLCTIRVGLCWYQVWSVLYHAARLVAVLALFALFAYAVDVLVVGCRVTGIDHGVKVVRHAARNLSKGFG